MKEQHKDGMSAEYVCMSTSTEYENCYLRDSDQETPFKIMKEFCIIYNNISIRSTSAHPTNSTCPALAGLLWSEAFRNLPIDSNSPAFLKPEIELMLHNYLHTRSRFTVWALQSNIKSGQCLWSSSRSNRKSAISQSLPA